MRTIILLLMGGLLGLLAGCGGGEDARELSPGEKAVRRMTEFYGGLQSVSVRSDRRMTVDAGPSVQEQDIQVTYLIEKPNRFVQEIEVSRPGFESQTLRIISDGKTILLPTPNGRAIERPAPADLGTIGAELLSGELVLSLMGPAAYEDLLGGARAVEQVGRETLDGVEAERVAIRRQEPEYGDLTLELWIAEGATPRLLQVQFEAIAKDEFGREHTIRSVDRFTDWEFDPSPPADAFAFESTSLLGKPAPDFEVTLLDGERFSLAAHRGHVVLLDFWATWCPPCVEKLPILAKVAEKYKDRGLVFCAVNQGEDEATVQSFLRRANLVVPVGFDRTGFVGGQFDVEGIPHVVVIGRDGSVQAIHVGYNPDAEALLSAEIERLLLGETLVAPRAVPADTPN